MKWLKKREIAMLYLLNSKFYGSSFTFFEALALLEVFFGRRVARNRIKYFIKTGIIIKVSEDRYRVKSISEVVEEEVIPYLIKRSERLRRRTRLSP